MSSAAEVLLASLQQTKIISLQEPFPILSVLISLYTFLKAEFTQRFKRFANKSLQLNKAFVLFFIQEKNERKHPIVPVNCMHFIE